MNSIGGYFGLELSSRNEYYPNLLKLNTGRNCLEYILKVRKYNKVYLPYYTCDVVLEPINKLGLNFEFYHIDDQLDVLFEKQLNENECIILNNYFGLKNYRIRKYTLKYKNVIIDNSQAFFNGPIKDVDTFYSARKFFGVSDGAYLAINKVLNEELEQDISYNRMSHLLRRLDISAPLGYSEFKKNDATLVRQPIKKMSNITRAILLSVEYYRIKTVREENFKLLHSKIGKYNELCIDISNLNGPMAYPFLCKKNGVREFLKNHSIFVATYWPSVFEWCTEDTIERYMTKYLLPLPVDQRYGSDEINEIIRLLRVVL